MTTRRTARVGAALVLVSAVLLSAACGVPNSSGVQYIRPGPEGGSTLESGGSPPPLPDDATTKEDLVENFLQAAAGSPDTAADRVRQYLRQSDQDGWQPDDEILVIRLHQDPFFTDDPAGGWLVQLDAQPVGELHPNGYLDPPSSAEPVEIRFRVTAEGAPDGQVNGDPLRLRIADPPPFLLLADTALANDNYYYPNPIYFWDPDHQVLVPDLRWLPLAGESVEQHPWTVIRWLLAGPAPELSRVEGLPAGTQHMGLPVWDDQRLVVNFNGAAIEGRPGATDLATQLAWSMPQLREGAELELRIDDRPQDVRPRPRPEPAEPVRFVVLDGIVYRYGEPGVAFPPVLDGSVNTGLLAAAVAGHGEVAALIRAAPEGGQRLTIARGRPGSDPVEQPTALRAERIGQPVWLGSGGVLTGLVVADGELYRFTSTGDVSQVEVSGLSGAIDAIAVAPERRRLALVAGGRLYLAQLRHDRVSVTLQAPRSLPTRVGNLTGVAFTHDIQLVVAGELDNRVGLHRITVDGGVEEQLYDLSNATVTTLVGHASRDHTDLPVLMYEANGQAYTFTGIASLVQPDQLADPPDSADSPPRAPFFLG